MDYPWMFFSYRGRIGRAEYFGGNVVINVISFGVQIIAAAFGGAGAPMVALLAGLISLLACWPATAVMVKRGHDRNRPAWFSIGVFATVFVAEVVWTLTKSPAALAVVIVLVVYQIVDYLFWPASPKAKRYDLRASGRAAAEVFS